MFALSELRDDMELELRSLASGSVRGANLARRDSADSRIIGRGSAQENGPGLRRLTPVREQDVDELAAQIRSMLPWRSLADGTPVAMDVVGAGLVGADDSIRPPGTVYLVIFVDSWDAADAVQSALFEVGGLDEAEWTAGWSRSQQGFREITIFPPLDFAA